MQYLYIHEIFMWVSISKVYKFIRGQDTNVFVQYYYAVHRKQHIFQFISTF